jgi:hypothetical protein
MKKLALVLIALSLTACLTTGTSGRKVENPNVPLERPGYSVLPPAGANWTYTADTPGGRFNLNFFKKIPDPAFHSLVAGIIETPTNASFESPKEFEMFARKVIEVALSPNRYRLLEKRFELDTKFGQYCIKYYIKTEDRRAVNRGNEPFLLFVDYGYAFVHPNNPNLMIQTSYSERGRPFEIRPELNREAEAFFDGIRMK